MKPTRSEYRVLLRGDLYAFAERAFYELNPTASFMANWHLEIVASALESCRRGEVTRLAICMPPRSLKSHLTSVSFVAFLLGHDPSAKIICSSYAQDLANKLAVDCRTILNSAFYKGLFPNTRASSERQALQEFVTTRQGFRFSTSVGGVLTGRGADYIIIDDPLRPEEALSETQRKSVNEWYDHTLYSRLNDKRNGRIILIMQRLHEDDLVGHVLALEPWKLVRFPAIAEKDETHIIQTLYGTRYFERRAGEALHPEREPLEILGRLRETMGEYNFAGQYQQAPAPLGGGLVKTDWFKTYTVTDRPAQFEMIFQSWDTANKPKELNDFSVCTTWGVKEKKLYLLHVLRERLDYPGLKRAVKEQAAAHAPRTILIEDKASGTQLIQELISGGMHAVKKYETTMDKVMRLHSVTSTIENGFVYLPDKAHWLADYLHELACFPNGKYDDQVDSTSQALDWFKLYSSSQDLGVIAYYKKQADVIKTEQQSAVVPASMTCPRCNGVMSQPIPNGLRCAQCGAQWLHPDYPPRIQYPSRKDLFNSNWLLSRKFHFRRWTNRMALGRNFPVNSLFSLRFERVILRGSS